MRSKLSWQMIWTILADLFFLWALLHYGLGDLESAWLLIVGFSPLSWIILGLVLFLLLYRSDFRSDLPLFAAGWALGYWGEWWGTTRGVWWYWNGARPPDYLPPLWGLGVLTVYRLGLLLATRLPEELPAWVRWGMLGSFVALPVVALGRSWGLLAAVDWRGRLDIHFFAGILAAAILLRYHFELRRDFCLYLGGTLLGGMYEYFGTAFGEWTYITGEVPPLWIAPLWGLAAAAMFKLALLLRLGLEKAWATLVPRARRDQAFDRVE